MNKTLPVLNLHFYIECFEDLKAIITLPWLFPVFVRMFRVEAGARWTVDDVTGRCCWVLLRCCDVSDLNRHTTSTVRVHFNSVAFFAERLARSFVITPANTCVQGWVPNFYTRVTKNTPSFSAKFPRLRKLSLVSVSQQPFGKCLSRSKVAGDCLSH